MTRRILFAYPHASPLCRANGINSFVFEASHLLASLGHWDVHILTDLSFGGDERSGLATAAECGNAAGITLHDISRDDGIPCAWGSSVIHRAERFHRAMKRLHAEYGYGLIECPDYLAPGFFSVRDKRTGVGFASAKLVTHLHGSTSDLCASQRRSFLNREDLYANYMEGYVKKYADVILSPSQFLLTPVQSAAFMTDRQYVRSGYPLFSPLVKTRQGDEAPGDIVVACVGHLEFRKGQDLLASAIKKLHESGSLDPTTRFVFCGNDGLGPERDARMSRTIGRILRGIPNWSISPAKPREELRSWLADAVDICVVPSRMDNYPQVVLEAAQAGCHLICSDGGGIPESIKDYAITGRVFPSEDVSGLAQALREALGDVAKNPGMRQLYASQFAVHQQRQCQQTVAVYESLIKPVRPPQIERTPVKEVFPRVSIIIPFYNAHEYARDTIQSAFASDYPNFEVILVNDGSTDLESKRFLADMAMEFPDLRIVNKANGGLGDARNAGLRIASGEFVVPLDADNMILPHMVRCCSKLLSERPDLSYVTTYFECLREKDQARIPWRLSPIAKPLGAVDPLLLLENTVGDALAMIRRADIEQVGGYATNIYCFEDWDLWLKFHERGMEGDVLPDVHFIYRLRETSMSQSVDAARGVRLQQVLMLQHEKLVTQQAIPITTLLLTEYWNRWRSPKKAVTEERPQDLLKEGQGSHNDRQPGVRVFAKKLRHAAQRLLRR